MQRHPLCHFVKHSTVKYVPLLQATVTLAWPQVQCVSPRLVPRRSPTWLQSRSQLCVNMLVGHNVCVTPHCGLNRAIQCRIPSVGSKSNSNGLHRAGFLATKKYIGVKSSLLHQSTTLHQKKKGEECQHDTVHSCTDVRWLRGAMGGQTREDRHPTAFWTRRQMRVRSSPPSLDQPIGSLLQELLHLHTALRRQFHLLQHLHLHGTDHV